MTMKRFTLLLLGTCGLPLLQARAADTPDPAVDRVGFPKEYQAEFQVLRSFVRTNEQKIVTIYGNALAAALTNAVQLPYSRGSVIVMETAAALKDDQGKVALDAQGHSAKAP